LQLLFGEDHDEDAAQIPWTNRHEFLNVSITTVGCSVICERRLADLYFKPLVEQYNKGDKSMNGSTPSSTTHHTSGEVPDMTGDDYIVIQVDGQGLDAGQRVLDLTSPLAMAGMYVCNAPSSSLKFLSPPTFKIQAH
jgi:hypothetical protein